MYGIYLIHWIYGNMGCVLINSKVDGRKFNKIGVKKAEHEKVILAWICLSLQILYNPAL